jgi:hypothetical protein
MTKLRKPVPPPRPARVRTAHEIVAMSSDWPRIEAESRSWWDKYGASITGAAGWILIELLYRKRASLRIRGLLDKAIDESAQAARELGDKLVARDTSMERWLSGMEASTLGSHGTAAALAVGGWDNMTQENRDVLSGPLQLHLLKLEQLALGIAAGLILLNRSITSRSAMYVKAAVSTYEVVVSVKARTEFAEEMSTLHATESCDGCIGEAAKGWVPVGTLIPIGERECGVHCRCTLQYR